MQRHVLRALGPEDTLPFLALYNNFGKTTGKQDDNLLGRASAQALRRILASARSQRRKNQDTHDFFRRIG
jgi:hypothetical protein